MNIEIVTNAAGQPATEAEIEPGERLTFSRSGLDTRVVLDWPYEQFVAYGTSPADALAALGDMLHGTGHRRRKANEIPGRMIDVWFCPTTGRVIDGLLGDDKVLCTCGRSNPAVPEEQTPRTGTHIKRFLRPATEAAWLQQIDQDTRRG